MKNLVLLLALAACGPAVPPPSRLTQAEDHPQLINSLPDLVRLINEGGVGGAPLRSVDALLDRLATAYPENISNYALVYASRSLQSASPEHPRVIAFGPEPQNYQSQTRLILAFPGDPSQPDFDKLEVLAQDTGTAALELAEVRFPGDHGGAPVVEERPARCAACHGDPVRPLWDSYPVWPGVYGSRDDDLDAQTSELVDYRAFAAQLGGSGRYRHFVGATTEVAHVQGGVNRATLTLSQKPNLRLTTVLSQMNYRRLAQAVMALPRYQPLKFAFLGAVTECFDERSGPGAWFPPDTAAVLGVTLDAVTSVATQEGVENNTAKIRRYFNVHGEAAPGSAGSDLSGFDESDAPRIAAIRYIGLLAGDDLRSWSMTLTPQAFSFATGGYGMFDFGGPLVDAMRSDPEIAAFLAAGGMRSPGPPVSLDCVRLAALSKSGFTPAANASLAAAAPVTAAALRSDGADEQQMVLRCMSCHTDPLLEADGRPRTPTAGAPYFPFQQPLALGRLLAAAGGQWQAHFMTALNAAADTPGRMPKAPRAPLSAVEKAAFIDLLSALAAEAPERRP